MCWSRARLLASVPSVMMMIARRRGASCFSDSQKKVGPRKQWPQEGEDRSGKPLIVAVQVAVAAVAAAALTEAATTAAVTLEHRPTDVDPKATPAAVTAAAAAAPALHHPTPSLTTRNQHNEHLSLQHQQNCQKKPQGQASTILENKGNHKEETSKA